MVHASNGDHGEVDIRPQECPPYLGAGANPTVVLAKNEENRSPQPADGWPHVEVHDPAPLAPVRWLGEVREGEPRFIAHSIDPGLALFDTGAFTTGLINLVPDGTYSFYHSCALTHDALRWLEHLDYVTRRIFAQDLLTTRSSDDLVPEGDTLLP